MELREESPAPQANLMLARYYSSSIARFVSPDWSPKPTPLPYAVLTDPQTLNLYSYVRNNPISRPDPDGHCPLCITAAIGAAVGAVSGAVAEYASEKFAKQPTDWTKIGHAAAGGLVTGALTGLAGPEAGFAAKLGPAIGANLAGGATERALEGKPVVDPKAMAADAGAGVLSAGGEALVEKLIGAPSVLKATEQTDFKTVYTVKSATEVAGEAAERNVVREVVSTTVDTATDAARWAAEKKKP